jgi:hypothetical protein
MNIKRPNLLRDALHNTHTMSGASIDYGRGCVVSAVATLMSIGETFDNAWKTVQSCLPVGYRIECIPETWKIEK